MNHSDPDHEVTDIYLAKSWAVIDRSNRKVLDYLAGLVFVTKEQESKAVA